LHSKMCADVLMCVEASSFLLATHDRLVGLCPPNLINAFCGRPVDKGALLLSNRPGVMPLSALLII
jgi:hypothetical protein